MPAPTFVFPSPDLSPEAGVTKVDAELGGGVPLVFG